MMIQEWLNLVLDVVVMIIAALLTTLAVQLHSNSAFAGASLFTLVSFGENLSGIVIYYTRLETSIGAVVRLKTFNETVKPEERDDEDVIPREDWPQSGIMEFKGVSASYRPAEDDDQTDSRSSEQPNLALRDIRLTIHAGEKVAICGRTGSGKSSLIALLLKLLDPVHQTSAADDNDNEITIDQTPLRRIDRAALRERIIAVPQEAVFLPDGCTVQANLDPSGACTLEECQAVLEAVGLWESVQERGGLAVGMSAGTLSTGQRQLLSLGRAVLRGRVRARRGDNGVGLGLGGDAGSVGGGILLLDEVSSSVDRETERVMQEIIAAEFKGYTILAVSHRLDMIMDFDTVVVMDRGKIVEVGKPVVLVSQAGTRFGNLVAAGAS
jgi:ABC-type multidrug transport system fused ATPase/permease subunit